MGHRPPQWFTTGAEGPPSRSSWPSPTPLAETLRRAEPDSRARRRPRLHPRATFPLMGHEMMAGGALRGAFEGVRVPAETSWASPAMASVSRRSGWGRAASTTACAGLAICSAPSTTPVLAGAGGVRQAPGSEQTVQDWIADSRAEIDASRLMRCARRTRSRGCRGTRRHLADQVLRGRHPARRDRPRCADAWRARAHRRLAPVLHALASAGRAYLRRAGRGAPPLSSWRPDPQGVRRRRLLALFVATSAVSVDAPGEAERGVADARESGSGKMPTTFRPSAHALPQALQQSSCSGPLGGRISAVASELRPCQICFDARSFWRGWLLSQHSLGLGDAGDVAAAGAWTSPVSTTIVHLALVQRVRGRGHVALAHGAEKVRLRTAIAVRPSPSPSSWEVEECTEAAARVSDPMIAPPCGAPHGVHRSSAHTRPRGHPVG